ncbi:MAG TPA: Calx-beta domain-containing protein [Acidimicrobiia bacterium]|nr:Calx-beta domain-containing protein [Acidimicrobiia bacterium]
MTGRSRFTALAALACLGSGLFSVAPAHASPPAISGYATNFDVGNGTDKECEGFEVEIEDITDTQITYTWPGSGGYPNPYGPAPAANITNMTFPDGHSGVRVKFVATYAGGAWSAKTPIGMVNHFGVHVNGTPGVQTYSWLCDLGGSAAGSTGVLTPYGGTTQGNYFVTPSVPSVVSTVVATPTGEQIQTRVAPAVIPEPAETRLPDAVWVLKYQASSPNPVDVNQLLVTDPEVQRAINNSQISRVAELFQPDPVGNEGVELEPGDQVNPGDASSVTVTETYYYTGPVDPVDNSITCNEIANDPNNCNNFVGGLIARQMVAANVTNATNRSTVNVNIVTGVGASTDGGGVSSSATPGANPGEIDCGASCFTSVDTGTPVNLTASPNPGYHLVAWSGACAGTSPNCTVNANGLTSVTATFYPDVPTVYVYDASAIEGAPGATHTMKFTALLTSPRATKTTVSYETVDGTALAGSDYTAKVGTMSIAAHKTTATVSVPVTGDNVQEGDETFGLALTGASGGVPVGTTQATGTILDDDATHDPVVSVGDASVMEGNSGTVNAVFTVTLSAPSATPTPVAYTTQNGDAVAGSDFVAKTGKVSIPAGSVSAKISIAVKGDTVAEGTESFDVKLTGTGSSGVPIDQDTGTGTIINDDGPSLTGAGIGDAAVVEGDTGAKNANLTVTLSAAQGTTTVVKYHTVNGTAAADGDYVAKTGSLTIAANTTSGTITIAVNGDTSVENDETFSVVLDSAGALPIDRATGTVTIVGDD